MNKEEYAKLNYLLTKLKYTLLKELYTVCPAKQQKEIIKTIKEIDDIGKVMIVKKD